jgi:hypothetical protein
VSAKQPAQALALRQGHLTNGNHLLAGTNLDRFVAVPFCKPLLVTTAAPARRWHKSAATDSAAVKTGPVLITARRADEQLFRVVRRAASIFSA